MYVGLWKFSPIQTACLLGFVSFLGAGGLYLRRPAPTPKSSVSPWFKDVTEQVNLEFQRVPDLDPPYFMPSAMGAGSALFDYDNDGRLDIYLLQDGENDAKATNGLFHQEPDGRFTDVTSGSGLGITGGGMGVAVGDVNNDGLPDVLVCGYHNVRLFLNRGQGKFRDITQQVGIKNPYWATSAAFFDYDRDGRLDLVIVNYVDYVDKVCPDAAGRDDYCGPASFAGTASQLYHNISDLPKGSKNVRFTDVSLASGIGRVTGPGLGVTALDFDGDNWQDIFITQDAQSNRLWLNQHNGTFKDEALIRGIAVNSAGQPQANMGIALADLNASGLPSVYVTHLTEESNTLWMPGVPGIFEDRTTQTGLLTARRGTGFGTVMSDFNNDGFPDLALVNGRVQRTSTSSSLTTSADIGTHWSPYAETNQLFAGIRGGKFREITMNNVPFCGTPNIGRGLACGDIWNDGGMALLSTPLVGPARLYRDKVAGMGHWLEVRAIDPRQGGRDAYGTRITLKAGGRQQTSWINPAYSMGNSNDPRAHFGLGSTNRVDKLEVFWPDGKRETFSGIPTNRIVTLQRGKGHPQ
ncbi:hypothetical protein IAD21_05211 [Abditibacteriota bacterium]|nr:hypothetical protein IAD21_05211 [Abditibacteriota bacterium]